MISPSLEASRAALARDVQAPLLSIEKLVVTGEDNVRIHPLCKACEDKAVLLGQALEPTLPVGFRVV